MKKELSLFNKGLSCLVMIAIILAAALCVPTMNADAATKKAAMPKTSVTLVVNQTYSLSVNNTKGKASWSTSDKNIVTVKKSGDRSAKITAKKAGTATITAKIGSKKYTCKVKVENPKMSATSKTLNTKDAKTATIQLNSTSQGSSVKWSTSNSKIVSIKASKNKVTMTAKKTGSATVTATLGGKKYSCKVTVEKSHNYKKGKTVAATCSKKGYTEYKCACGKSYKKEIVATGKHSYTVKKKTVAATCTEDGYTVYKCKTCDKTTKKTIEATGHDWDAWQIIKEPTDTEDGEKSHTCTICGTTETDPIHHWGEWEIPQEPIYTENSEPQKKHTCTICGTTETKTMHHWDEWNKTDATCTSEGSYSRYCERCSETEEIGIPATGHIYDYAGEKDGYKWVEKAEEFEKDAEVDIPEYTCSLCGLKTTDYDIAYAHVYYNEKDGAEIKTGTKTVPKHYSIKASGHYEKVKCGVGGEKIYLCTQCGDTYTEKVDAANAHEYDEGQITQPATCTETGIITYTCTVCGQSVQNTTSTISHDWSDWETTIEPTYTDEGAQTHTCKVCGEKETEALLTLNETDHQWVEWKIISEASCEYDGEERYICEICGKTEIRSIPATGHNFGEWVITKEATDTEEGEQTRTCQVCGITEIQPIPKLTHNDET